MKKISSSLLFSCFMLIIAMSCMSDKDSEKNNIKKNNEIVSNEFPTLTGEFIHVDTAAVLKVNNKLYGVKMDDMAKSVVKEAEKIKIDDYDVINVVIRGEIMPNPEPEGWEEIVTIKTLDKIYKPQQKEENKVLKYSSKKTE